MPRIVFHGWSFPTPSAWAFRAWLVLTLLVGSPVARSGTPGLVAVLPFDAAEARLEPGDRRSFEESVRTIAGDALAPLGYTVLTGETTIAVMEENGVDVAKVCEASCALDAAKELKTRFFVSGTLARSEGELIAFVRVFEVPVGRQLGSVQVSGTSVKELRQAFTSRADTLFLKAIGGGARSELRFDDVTVTQAPVVKIDVTRGGIGEINLAVEKLLDHALELDVDRAATPDQRAAAWCRLAAVEDRNAYRTTGREACFSWRGYANASRRQRSSLLADYHTLAGYLALKRKPADAKIGAIEAFLSTWASLADDPHIQSAVAARRALAEGGAPQLAEEHTALEASCATSPAACVELGTLVQGGAWPLEVRDGARALKLFSSACEAGFGPGCVRAGAALADAADPGKASALYRRACDAEEPEGCVRLAERPEIRADPLAAATLYRRGCDGGEASGCAALGAMYRDRGGLGIDEAKAQDAFALACEAGDVSRCEEPGTALATSGDDAVRARATRLLQRGCDGGRGGACLQLSKLQSDPERAAVLLEQGCEAASAASCGRLGQAFASGKGRRRDDARALGLFRKGCDGGDPASCVSVAVALREALGTKRDVDGARRILGDACSKESAGRACVELARTLELHGHDPADEGRAYSLLVAACGAKTEGACEGRNRLDGRRVERRVHDVALQEHAERENLKSYGRLAAWVPAVFAAGALISAVVAMVEGSQLNDRIMAGDFGDASHLESLAIDGMRANDDAKIGLGMGLFFGAIAGTGFFLCAAEPPP